MTVVNARAHAKACRGGLPNAETARIVVARTSFKRMRACRTWPRQGTWPTGSRGLAGETRTPDGHVSPGAGRRQMEQETAALSFPMAAVGDGSVTHEARSGGGPGEDFLADTGR